MQHQSSDSRRAGRTCAGGVLSALAAGALLLAAAPGARAQAVFSLSTVGSASPCDAVVMTNVFQNAGSTLDELIITNAIPGGAYYVTNASSVTLPNGQVLTGAAAEPTVVGGSNLVWDLTGAASDSGINHLLITEVFYDPTNAQEDEYEWIEIYNPTPNPISLSGYTIVDALPGQSDALGAETVQPGQYVIIAASTSGFYAVHGSYTGLVIACGDLTLGSGLNNFGDGVFLKDGSAATVDAISYGGSSAAFSPGVTAGAEGQSLQRNPVNADNNTRNDWIAGAPTLGSGTALSGIAAGGSVTIKYRVELSCAAQTAYFRAGARYRQPAGGAVQSASAVWNLSLTTPNLTVTKRPSVQTGGYGDTVVWTVRVENAGFGRADNVVITDTRGPGIRFTGFSVPPTNAAPYSSLSTVAWDSSVLAALASLDYGESASVVITGEVAACTGLYNNVTVRNGCSGLSVAPNTTCFDSSVGGNEGGSVEFLYRYALVSGSLGPSLDFSLPTCGGRDLTLYFTNAAGADVGAALGMYVEPTLPAGYTLSGAAYQTNLNRIHFGDLAPGSATSVTVRLQAGGSCPLSTAPQQLVFRPYYTDACGTPYTTPPLNASSTLGDEPAASITKTVGSVSGTASSTTVRIYLTYANLTNTVVSFHDQLPVNTNWSIANVSAGAVFTNSTTVRWQPTLTGSGVYTASFDLVWTDPCEIGGQYANRVVASNFVDCVGCTRSVAGSGEYAYFTLSSANCSTSGTGVVTCAFSFSTAFPNVAEACSTITVTSRVTDIAGLTTANWDAVVFSNNLAGAQATLVDGSVRVFIDGVDHTASAYLTHTARALRITFTNLNGSAVPSPGQATNLYLSWEMTPTNSGQHTVSSSFTLPGCTTRSTSSGLNVGDGALEVTLQPLDGQDACGPAYGQIDLRQFALPALSALSNRNFAVYDVEVVLDLDVNGNAAASYTYVTNSSSFSNMWSLAGTALPGSEPAVTTTQLVWSLGDLRTNGAGSIFFTLLGDCSIEGGERLRAYARYNPRCQDGVSPATRSAYSSTNTVPAFFSSTLTANLEPEISYLPGTSYVYRIEVFNSGAGAAYNVRAEVAKPANISFSGAGVAPVTASATNLVWTFQIADGPGGLVDGDGDGFEDDLPPNASFTFYVTNTITSCDPRTIRLTVSGGCKGDTCATAQDTAQFVPSTPSLNATTTFPNNHYLCATGRVSLAIRNSGAGRAYTVEARHTIPAGVTYLPGSSQVSIDGGTTNAIADPSGDGTSGNPLMWNSTAVAAFADLAPNQEVRILYNVYLACDSVVSAHTYSARTTYRDNCGNGYTNDVSSASVAPGQPVLTLTKYSRNVTLGQASFTTATVPGNPGDVLAYRLTVDHTVGSQADALALKMTDVLPATITYLGASPTPDAINGQTLIWSNSTLMAHVGGAPYLRSADAFHLYITGVVATCTASVQNLSYLHYGCSESCLSLGATSRVYHTFTPQISPNVGSGDGMQLHIAAGVITMTLTNTAGGAVSLVVTQAAPAGYLITSASVTGEFVSSSLNINLLGSPAGKTGVVDFTTAASSGATDVDDDLGDGLTQLDLGYGNAIRLTFNLISDGSNADCRADPTDHDFADPAPPDVVSVSARFGVGWQDACDQAGAANSTVSVVPLQPDPDVDLQPNSLLVSNGHVQVFTATLRNRGEQGHASNLHMRIRYGTGWTNLSIVSTSLVQSGSGSVITELQGSSNVLVSLPGVILDPLDDQVVLTMQATARESAGSLEVLAEIVGEMVNGAIPETCAHTNIFGAPPMADTMQGIAIGPVNGNYYAFDQDRNRSAGFTLAKTVRLAGEAPPGGTNLNARIGEDLIYRIETRFFGVAVSNVTVTESLPAHLNFGTPVDAGSSGNASGWSYAPGTGIFTLPSPITTDAVFVVDIPVIVSNRAANQGDAPAPVAFTNAASADFDADGVTNPIPASYTQVTIVEPALQLAKTAGFSTQRVQAGDLVVFTNRVTHTAVSLTNAYDLVFVDALPAGLTFSGVDLGNDGLDNDADGVADGADAADESSLASGNTFTVTTNNSAPLASLAVGGELDFLVPAYVLNQTLGSVIVNTGRVTWTSLPGGATNHNERDGSGGFNDYSTNGTASVTSKPIGSVTKTLHLTSETGTVDPRVTIGERLIYRVRVDFPPGSVTNAVIVDNVATGLDFVGTNPDAGLTYPGLGYGFVVPQGGPQVATNAAMGLVVTDPDPTPASSVDVSGSGRAITFSFGGITNAPDGIETNDFFDLYLEFVVLQQATNNGLSTPAFSNANRVVYTDTLNSLGATSAYYVIGEPDVRLRKVRSPASGAVDAGDVITFSLIASNLQTATANTYDLIVADTLTNRFWDLNSITLVETAVGWSYATVSNANAVQVRFTSDPGTYLAPGQQATNRFSVALVDSSVPNTVFTNRGDILISDTISGSPPLGTTSRTDTANATVTLSNRNFGITKTLQGTSETGASDSTTTNVQIGEAVSYVVAVAVPEGTITNLAVTDLLPPGLGYVLGSATVDVSALNGTLPALTEEPNGTGVAPGGSNVTFTFTGATVIAPDNDTGNNTFNLYLTTVVRDTNTTTGLSGNTTFLTNRAAVTYLGNPRPAATSGAVVVRAIEPQVLIAKNVVETDVDAGDTVEVQLTITNSGLATAFDLEIQDALEAFGADAASVTPLQVPANFTLSASNGYAYLRASDGTTPPQSSLEAGESLTVRFEVDMGDQIPPLSVLTNRATVALADTIHATNLYGIQRSAAGAQAQDTVNSGTIGLLKELTATSETGFSDSTNDNVQVGEVVTYRLTVGLPEGSVTNLQVVDVLPAGLGYVHGSAAVDTGSFNGSLPALAVTPAGSGVEASGQDMTFTWSGTAVVAGDNNDANDSFTLSFQAVVLDVGGNQGLSGAQTHLTNTAVLSYQGAGTSITSGPVAVHVTEPQVTIAKSLSVATGDAGDPVTVTLVITNTGLASAYEVQVQDVLDADWFDASRVLTGTVAAGFTMVVTGAPDPVVVIAASGLSEPPANVLEAREGLRFTFTTYLAQAVSPGATLTNRATVRAADSIYQTADYANERSAAGAQAQATLVVSNLSLAKQLIATSATGSVDTTGSDVTIGEVATYRLTVTLPEGSVSNLVITDVLPAGLQYVGGSVAVDTAGFAGQLPGAPAVSGGAADGEDVAFTFSGVTIVTNDNAPANNSFALLVGARVLDTAGNDGLPVAVDGDAATILTNRVTAGCVGCQGSALTSAVVTVNVVEPSPAVSKRVATVSGDWMRSTIAVTNRGASTAYDIVVTDLFPADIWVTSSLTGSVPAGFVYTWSNAAAGRLLTVASDPNTAPPASSLETGESFVITVTGQLVEGFSGTSANTATVTRFTTLSGTDAGERDEPDVLATAIFGAPDIIAFLRGTDLSGLPLVSGDTVLYRVTLTNAGGATATGVQLLNVVPTNTTLVSGSVTNRGNPAGVATSVFTLDIGSLEPGASAVVSYLVTINSGLPLSVTTIYNRATATWNESPRTEVADNDQSGHDTTVDNGADDTADSGTATDDDDPTLLFLTSSDFTMSKVLVSPTGRPAHIGEVVQFRVYVTNSGGVNLSSIPLSDSYETTYLTFLNAEPKTVDSGNDGTVNWSSIGSIAPGASVSALVRFTAKAATANDRTNTATASPVAQAPYPAPSPKSATAAYRIDATTYASIHSFRAVREGKRTALEWETAAEVGTIGFYLWRRDEPSGPATRVQEDLLAAYGLPQGGLYRLADPAAEGGRTYHYELEEVEDHGGSLRHGPFTVTIPSATSTRGALAATGPRPGRAVSAPPALHMSGTAATGEWAAVPAGPEGIYEITASDLAAVWNLSVTEVQALIARGDVEVRRGGRRLPALLEDGRVRFYAAPWTDRYAASDCYYVRPGRNVRLQAEAADASPLLAASFTETAQAESNRLAVMTIVLDPAEDYWVWEQLIAGQANADKRSVAVRASGLASGAGDATVTVRMLGGSNSDPSPDHRVVVRVNGTQVGEMTWEGRLPHEATFAVATSLLVDGTNAVEVQAYKPAGVPYSLVYLDYVRLAYPRRFAASGALGFPGDGRAVTVEGLSPSTWRVLDVTEPEAARQVSWAVAADGAVTLPGTQPGHRYFAWDDSGVRRVTPAAASLAAALASPTNAWDYLVIAAPGLETPAGTLAEHRRAGGLRAAVVALNDVYAAFGHGVPGPEAIRAFLAYAGSYWAAAPRYVVLAGDGTYDYLNQLGYNDSLLPPALIATPNGLFSSDAPYADIDGDATPELAVGRLPARSASELQTMVQKIIAYEAASGAWTKDALVLADNSDSGGAFESESDAVSAVLTSRYSVSKAYLATLGLSAARSAALQALNRGVSYVNYAGHGALDRLAQEGLLTSSDVASLTNGVRTPLLVSMTCVVGRYSVPGFPCLGEELLRSAPGGAVGVISPVGLSSRSLSGPLNASLARRLGLGGGRLGDIWLDAALDFTTGDYDPLAFHIFNVLGDPALVIK